MKHKIVNLSLIAGLLFSGLSCQDAIDIIQDGELTIDKAFQNTNDLNMFLQGSVYNSLDLTTQISFTSQFTDEVGIGPANSNISTAGTHQFFVDVANGSASSIWAADYYTINRVNRLLDGAKLIMPADATEQKRYNSILGEARAARAYAYLDLISYFSPDMKDPNGLGVMILEGVPKTLDENRPRSTNGEVYKVIEEDFAFAEQNIDQDPANYLYFTKNAINGLRARFYLYIGDYTKAQLYAQKVIAESGLTLTPATPVPTGTLGSTAWWTALNAYSSTNPYVKMWNDSSRGEVVFGFSRPLTGVGGTIASVYTTNTSTYNGSVTWDMGRNLFNILDKSPGDIRRYAYLDVTSKIDPNYLTSVSYKTTDGLVIKKYPGKYNGAAQLKNDIKVVRLAEMYLILAESAANSGDLAGVALNLKKIRDARNYNGPTPLPVYATTQAAWKDILKERRVELAFEGHRYIDLRRLGKIANEAIDRSVVDDMDKTFPLTIPIDDHRFVLPIPRNELMANPTLQQNPGYETK